MQQITLLTTAEAAEILGVTAGRVRAYIAEGRLAAQRMGEGRDWMIRPADVRRFQRRPPGRPAQPVPVQPKHTAAA